MFKQNDNEKLLDSKNVFQNMWGKKLCFTDKHSLMYHNYL